MTSRLRWWVKALTPPILLLGAKKLSIALGLRRPDPVPPPEPDTLPPRPEPPEWEYVPEGWRRPAKGWDVAAVADAQVARWPAFLRAVEANGPLGIHHEAATADQVASEDHSAHNTVLSYGYVLARAAHGRERLSVLDWGGGIGHYFALSRALLPEVELDWCVKDVPALAERGREVLPEVEFTADNGVLARRFDLVLASGSLQYAEDWRATLAALSAAAARFLYVTRLPVALDAPSFVVLQRAYAHGYDTEYLGWVLSRAELLAEARSEGLELERELLLEAWLSAEGAPERPIGHRGYVFRPPGR
jgi:putative methyltransferase (TIGR04325 family)